MMTIIKPLIIDLIEHSNKVGSYYKFRNPPVVKLELKYSKVGIWMIEFSGGNMIIYKKKHSILLVDHINKPLIMYLIENSNKILLSHVLLWKIKRVYLILFGKIG